MSSQRVDISVGVLHGCAGSAAVHLGGTRVFCGVHGPSLDFTESRLQISVQIAPFAFPMSQSVDSECAVDAGSAAIPHKASSSEGGTTHVSSRPPIADEEAHVARSVHAALERVCVFNNEHRWGYSISLQVLSTDGLHLAAATTAATAAMACAGVEMSDLVVGVTCCVPSSRADAASPVGTNNGSLSNREVDVCMYPSWGQLGSASSVFTLAVGAKSSTSFSMIQEGSCSPGALATVLQAVQQAATQQCDLLVSALQQWAAEVRAR